MSRVRLLQEGADCRMRASHRLQQGDNIAELAKCIHRQERRQGKNQLRFVVRIFVVTLGGGERDTGGVLAGETFFRGLLVGMHLN